MKDDLNGKQKVSLLFYSEEDGKRTLIDKWDIEVGKKYNIGRSKKKVDISIQDITISRIHCEFIFYDKDKIMIKDFNSSNGTYINKIKIEPNKENYFSSRDNLSIGNERNQLIFSVEKRINKKEEEKKDIFREENIIKEDQKNYSPKKIRYYKEKENEKEENEEDDDDEQKIYNYKTGKFEKYKKYIKNRSRSRDSKNSSHKKKYNKKNKEHKIKKKLLLNSEKSKKNKHKNILSYIVKREEEIEKENNKRQIELYNEYLKIKEEIDEKLEMKNLPNLLPVLKAKSSSEDNNINSYENENEKEYIKLPNFKRKKRIFNKFDIKYKKKLYIPRYKKRIRGYKKRN